MAIIKDLVRSGVRAANLSRIYKYYSEYPTGTISAFRSYKGAAFEVFAEELKSVAGLWEIPEADKYRMSYSENMKRHRLLGAQLRAYGLKYIAIFGVYRENGTAKASKEASYFVWHEDADILKKALVKLGNSFEQDSITYCLTPKGKYQLINTSPFTGKVGAEIVKFDDGTGFGMRGHPKAGKDDEQNYSEIRGRPFTWLDYRADEAEENDRINSNAEGLEYNNSVRGQYIKALKSIIPNTDIPLKKIVAQVNPYFRDKLLNRIEAAGLSRIVTHYTNNPSATISAFRKYKAQAFKEFAKEIEQGVSLDDIPEAQKYIISFKENVARHRLLGEKLFKLGINRIQITGFYKEEGTNELQKELSYFVWYEDSVKLKNTVMKLATEFEQDSITYSAEPNGDYKLINTSPFSNNIGAVELVFNSKRFNLGNKKDLDFYSSIRGKPFMWDIYEPKKIEAHSGVKLYPTYSMQYANAYNISVKTQIKASSNKSIAQIIKELPADSGRSLLEKHLLPKLYK